MEYVYCSLMGYFIGALNPSYFLAKKKGFDIRTKGSGNAGASNALILFGKAMGVLCAVLDIAKAFFAIYFSRLLFPQFRHAFAVTGVSCILGHIFPFYMKFKGGKGLACLGGTILFYDWRVFLIMLGSAVLLAVVTDYICFVPVVASVTFPVVYGLMEWDLAGACILAVVSIVMVLKHLENFRRIRQGTEMHLSYLWKPKAELERMKESFGETGDKVENHFSGRKL